MSGERAEVSRLAARDWASVASVRVQRLVRAPAARMTQPLGRTLGVAIGRRSERAVRAARMSPVAFPPQPIVMRQRSIVTPHEPVLTAQDARARAFVARALAEPPVVLDEPAADHLSRADAGELIEHHQPPTESEAGTAVMPKPAAEADLPGPRVEREQGSFFSGITRTFRRLMRRGSDEGGEVQRSAAMNLSDASIAAAPAVGAVATAPAEDGTDEASYGDEQDGDELEAVDSPEFASIDASDDASPVDGAARVDDLGAAPPSGGEMAEGPLSDASVADADGPASVPLVMRSAVVSHEASDAGAQTSELARVDAGAREQEAESPIKPDIDIAPNDPPAVIHEQEQVRQAATDPTQAVLAESASPLQIDPSPVERSITENPPENLDAATDIGGAHDATPETPLDHHDHGAESARESASSTTDAPPELPLVHRLQTPPAEVRAEPGAEPTAAASEIAAPGPIPSGIEPAAGPVAPALNVIAASSIAQLLDEASTAARPEMPVEHEHASDGSAPGGASADRIEDREGVKSLTEGGPPESLAPAVSRSAAPELTLDTTGDDGLALADEPVEAPPLAVARAAAREEQSPQGGGLFLALRRLVFRRPAERTSDDAPAGPPMTQATTSAVTDAAAPSSDAGSQAAPLMRAADGGVPGPAAVSTSRVSRAALSDAPATTLTRGGRGTGGEVFGSEVAERSTPRGILSLVARRLWGATDTVASDPTTRDGDVASGAAPSSQIEAGVPAAPAVLDAPHSAPGELSVEGFAAELTSNDGVGSGGATDFAPTVRLMPPIRSGSSADVVSRSSITAPAVAPLVYRAVSRSDAAAQAQTTDAHVSGTPRSASVQEALDVYAAGDGFADQSSAYALARQLGGAVATSVQRAEGEATAEAPPAPEAGKEQAAAGAPDVEALAMQVYDRIRQRLLLERERSGARPSWFQG